MTGWLDDLVELDEKYPDATVETVAARFVDSLSRPRLEDVARAFAAEVIRDRRRSRTRDLERRAATPVPVPQPDYAAEREMHKAEREAMWRANPSAAPRNSRIYREWTQTPDGQVFLDQDRKRRDEQAEKERLRVEDPDAYREKYSPWRQMQRIFENVVSEAKQEARLELTAELLGASFAVGDGRSVSWGEATVADHEARVEYLLRHVEGNLATVRIHEIASRMLHEANARCLSDLAGVCSGAVISGRPVGVQPVHAL